MFHDTQSIRIDDSFTSDAARPEPGVLRRIAGRVIAAIYANPTDAEIASWREYRRLREEAWKNINRTVPAYIRRRMNEY